MSAPPTEATGQEQGVVDPGAAGARPGAPGAGAGTIGPAQDHGRASLVCLAITVGTMAASGGVTAAFGVPRETTEVAFILVATLLGFGFCGGQAAMVTGFLAMKQRQNPLWVLPSMVGLLLGIVAFVALFGLSMYIGAQRAGLRF